MMQIIQGCLTSSTLEQGAGMRIVLAIFIIAGTAGIVTAIEKAWQTSEAAYRSDDSSASEANETSRMAKFRGVTSRCLELHYTGRRVLPEVKALALDMAFGSLQLQREGLGESAAKSELSVRFRSRIEALERKLGEWEVSRMFDYFAALSQDDFKSCVMSQA